MEAKGGALKAGPAAPEKGAKYNSRCRPGTLIRPSKVVEPASDRLSPKPWWAYSYCRVRGDRQTMS